MCKSTNRKPPEDQRVIAIFMGAGFAAAGALITIDMPWYIVAYTVLIAVTPCLGWAFYEMGD